MKGPGQDDALHDAIGFWSEIKLDIVREYLPAYTTILRKQAAQFRTLYVDAFAGSGKHISKTSGELVMGSPAIALDTKPPFDEYHFIDMDAAKVKSLEEIAVRRPDTFVHHGDCNEILSQKVFPRALYKDYRRALCFLDPYNLQLDWKVIAEAGEMRSVEIFLNFPIYDINRNVLWRDPTGVSKKNIGRMTRFWGDESWRDIGYRQEPTLFGTTLEKVEGSEIAEAFRQRLQNVAKFSYVPPPMAMKNRMGGVVYYLFFASYSNTGRKIVQQIFDKYRKRGYAR